MSGPAPDEPNDQVDQPQDQQADQERTGRRAELLPEELGPGSEDPEAQAAAILAESDERTDHPEETRHESSQTLGG